MLVAEAQVNDHKPAGKPGVKRKTAQTGTWKQLTYHNGTVCSNECVWRARPL